MDFISSIRKLARGTGVGRIILKARQFYELGVRRSLRQSRAKREYLGDILRAQPLRCNAEGLEVHMLLQHKRVLEGMWSFYSFARFVPGGCKVVVHDDGSLQAGDVAALNKVFPACSVIKRSEADILVNQHFNQHGLSKCRQMRDSLIFGLKLFDVALFAKAPHVLLLDSDVLTISECAEITRELRSPEFERKPLYMQDVRSQYCLTEPEMRRQLGQENIVAFSPGIALVPACRLDFSRLELYLNHPGFWNADGLANYFAELTLWAMELALNGAQPLPKTYAVYPTKPGLDGIICCHYCGGVEAAYLFYSDGLARVRKDLVNAGLLTLER